MLLPDLIQNLPVRIVRGDPVGVRVCDITEDSRTAVPGSLFCARRGLKSDGRAFCVDAAAAGATVILTDEQAVAEGIAAHVPPGVVLLACADVPAVSAQIAERYHGEPTKKLFLIGVTGTNGKTTIAHIVHRVLNRAGVRCGLIGTVEIDDGRELAPAAMTTPPAIELSRTFASMVEAGCTAAVMEVSSHALDQKRADALAFDAAIFTNLTGDHLDYHKTMDAYAAAKRRLFALMGANTRGGGPAIVNVQDARARFMAEGGGVMIGCALVEAGAGETGRLGEPPHPGEPTHPGEAPHTDAAWRAAILEERLGWTRLRVSGRVGGEPVVIERGVELVGRHNAMNVLQAMAACAHVLSAQGVRGGEAAQRLGDALSLIGPPTGRLEPAHSAADDIAVLVDFAHTDDGLEKALSALRPLVGVGRSLWVVFGCGGDKDATKRPRMGAVAARLADRVVLTSDNPRSESPGAIVRAILEGVPAEARARVDVQVERERAIEFAVRGARSGDVVLIAGKGHEREQIFSDGRGGLVSRPFDDAAEATRCLAARRAARDREERAG